MAGIFERLLSTITGSSDDPSKISFLNVTDEPLESLHELIDAFLEDTSKRYWYEFRLNESDVGKRISKLDAEDSRSMILATLSRLIPLQKVINDIKKVNSENFYQDKTYQKFNQYHEKIEIILRALLRRKLPFTEADLIWLMDYALMNMVGYFNCYSSPISGTITALEHYDKEHALGDELVSRLKNMDEAFQGNPGSTADERKVHTRIVALLGEGGGLNIIKGEAWSDVAIEDFMALDESNKEHWFALLNHCQAATTSKPNAKWTKQAKELIAQIDAEQFQDFVSRWFPLVDKPHTVELPIRSEWEPDPNKMINDQHMDILKGLTWCCAYFESDDIAKAVNRLAITAYKKVAGIGPRATRVGNACVYVLGEMPGMVGVYQLALLKVRVNFRTALKGIEKSLAIAGERVGMSVDELEEIGVPAYGLTEVGKLTESLGDFTAVLKITGTTSTELGWIKADGKSQKSVPKAVKENFAEELKELKTAAKDIQKMLPAQRQRLDNLFLQQREWTYSDWKQNYLDHPLVGYLARRLIWSISNAEQQTLAIWHDNILVNVKGDALDINQDGTTVSLWHPIESELDEIKLWREWLENHEVIQPFKQAHREIYLLTDAERTTNVYSNRFAAHIIKQHQFNALAVQRDWKYSLQGCWDGGGDEIAKLVLPKWGLWAEFWVSGIGEYGNDTTEAGIFNYIATDQVRFYQYGKTDISDYEVEYAVREEGPTPIENIPPLVLSEVFRDVDLFVGVASVGNDPEWSDGGPEGQYRDYWNTYSFGDLNATAKTRKDVLERLIPRLKIASRCELTDKFLIVRGDVRSYKIHLGSGNILMTPNDQYLCIVLARGKKGSDGKIFLPFEGDTMLSIILSKAFMLADDTKIKDKTILSQINP